ncbi:MAG: ABC transporter substrate-binding protein [Selenomonas sp.]|nr:ABC transporter substrate-binding protein [Selenomonas sp.]MBQ1809473.1 ABC transporter substrate-binding protein [Selenomonas sp.]MBQ4212822.1 ABC transporter substrate-binding protein [Selenomonas sp.]MBQ5420548.1 ABC transporter substrate-binding protein [Selenomonas sp.]MBQ5503317.1 ABC transporter substrate-binding protein [Selenomonas sp.]
MKKIIALLLAAAMMIVVAGCGGGDQAASKGGNSGSGSKQITMGFSQIGAESEWRTANTESIKQAAKDAGINLQFSDAQQKQENQIKAIRSFIAQGVDIIAFVPIVETGWDTVLKEAKDAKIPVVVVDRDVKLSDDSLYVAKIGTDSIKEGNNVFKWIDEYMTKEKKTPRDGGSQYNVVVLEGTVGSSVAIRRQEGFKDALAKSANAGKYNILASQTGEFTRQKGQEVMESFLKSYGPKIDILFAHNDDMALGAIQAIEKAGLKPGKDITIISIDGVKGMFQAMIDGKANCTVECNPLQGPLLMETAKKILAGEKVEKLVYVDEGVFPADVAAKTLPERKY